MNDSKTTDVNTTTVCSVCGSPVNAGQKFCTSCGSVIEPLKEEAPSPACPVCGSPVNAGQKFCTSCGSVIEPVKGEAPSPACPVCGSPVNAGQKFCTSCGSTIQSNKPAPAAKAKKQKSPKKAPGAVSVILTILLCIILLVFETAAISGLFIYSLAEDVTFPDIGGIDGSDLTSFFSAWYPIAICAVLVILPLVLIFVANSKRIRRAFFSAGFVLVLTGAVNIALAFLMRKIIVFLPDMWQAVLINATVSYRDIALMCSAASIVLGAICLSVYACISIIRGKRHE